jgi:hypothetical protein
LRLGDSHFTNLQPRQRLQQPTSPLKKDFSLQRELYESTPEARNDLSLQETVTHLEIKPRRWLQPLKSSTRLSALSMKAGGNQLVHLEFTYLFVLEK